jgi:hypothetical protein
MSISVQNSAGQQSVSSQAQQPAQSSPASSANPATAPANQPSPGPTASPSQQNPAASAQEPEPSIQSTAVRSAVRAVLAPPSLTIPRLSHPPVLEDFLGMKPEGEIAQRMTPVTGFVQRNPHNGNPVSKETWAYLGYDQKNLYVVFVCFDDPRKVRARMSRREDIYDDDQVEIMLDTFHDRRRAYAFQTTPLGVQWDAIWTEAPRSEVGGNFDTSFDTVWSTRGKITSRGFVVWMSIPFKSLRFPATKVQEWGIILYRGIYRDSEDSFWPWINSKIEGRLGQAATLDGLEGISPGRDVELIPYGVMRGFRALDQRDPYNPFFQNADVQGTSGMDAKFVIHDHFVLDLTANPDFSQVESEDPQITVNQRFEVYFPEKRPFFLENEDYFRTPFDLFFTRNIQDPSAGVRLTGKQGPYSLGIMSTDDRAPGFAVPQVCPPTSLICADNLYGIRSYFTIARLNRDLFKQSSVGVIYSDWECPTTGEFNRVGGADTRVKIAETWTLEGQAVTSSSKLFGLNAYLSPTGNLQTSCEDNLFPFSSGSLGNGNYFAGPADRIDLRRNGLHLIYHGSYQDVSPGFVTVPGFVNRVDIRDSEQHAAYFFRPKDGWVTAWGPGFYDHNVWDHEGNRLDSDYEPYVTITGRGRTVIQFAPYEETRERLRPQDFAFIGLSGVTQNWDYHEHRSGAKFQTGFLPKVAFGASYFWGDGGNFVPAVTDVPRALLSHLETGTATLTFRPMKPLKIENTYLFERLRATDNEYQFALQQLPVGSALGRGIFNNHIVRSKWNWQFTPALSLRLILQYNAVLANTPGNTYTCSFDGTPVFCPYTDLPTQKEFNADFLLTYLVHPGTAIYVGYNSDLQNLDHEFTPGPLPAAGLYSSRGYINDSRQFFVKVSYLFRF